MELETTTRKWGNSIAIIIPSHIVAQRKIHENQKIKLKFDADEPLLVKDVFGIFKGKFKQSTQEIKDEMRKGWLSKSDKEREEEWKRKQKTLN